MTIIRNPTNPDEPESVGISWNQVESDQRKAVVQFVRATVSNEN